MILTLHYMVKTPGRFQYIRLVSMHTFYAWNNSDVNHFAHAYKLTSYNRRLVLPSGKAISNNGSTTCAYENDSSLKGTRNSSVLDVFTAPAHWSKKCPWNPSRCINRLGASHHLRSVHLQIHSIQPYNYKARTVLEEVGLN